MKLSKFLLFIFPFICVLKVSELNVCWFYNKNNSTYALCDGVYTIDNASIECNKNGYCLAENIYIQNNIAKSNQTILNTFSGINRFKLAQTFSIFFN